MQASDLDFAYRYPFTAEAKKIVSENSTESQNRIYAETARARVAEALTYGKIAYRNIGLDSEKLSSIISYAYARLIISATQSPLAISKYADAEAKRAVSALEEDSAESLVRLAKELNVSIEHANGTFYIKLEDFLAIAPKTEDYALPNLQLEKGVVILGKHKACHMLSAQIAAKVKEGLPIKKADIPAFIFPIAKGLPSIEEKVIAKGSSSEWIERLLQNPIADGRQRVVNLILAPYLVNVKKLDVDSAYKIISDYIEKCKALDSTTKLTNSQIRYQCIYSKEKGMRPLSLQKAKELLAGIVDPSIFD